MSYRGGLGIGLRVGGLVLLGFLALGCGGDDDDSAGNSPDKKDAGDDVGQSGKGGSGGADQGSTGKPDGGGQAGQGGAGGKGSSGAGGSNAQTDAGSSAVSCDNVQNPCKKAGRSCDANTLVTCAEDANGCLVETYADCNRGTTDFCDPDTSPPSCAMDPCAGLRNACTVVGKTCDGTDLVKCAQNDDGCLVNTTTDCTKGANNSCTETGKNKAECKFDECSDADGKPKENVCVENAASCAGDVLVNCVEDDDGCPIATRTDCTDDGDNNYCKDGADPVCAFDPCIGVTSCLTAGTTCDNTNLVDCAANGDGCLVTSTTNCANPTGSAPVMETCDPSGTAHCAACTNACPTEGAKTCDGDTASTCMFREGETCLSLVEQACGSKFSCVVDEGCVYDGGDVCDGPNNADDDHGIRQVLAPGSSAGPFMTTDAGKDFSNYSCPTGTTRRTTIQAQSQDILFALDVPANTVALVTITDVSGFATDNAPWLVVLSRCGDGSATAEASCLSASRTDVSYVNETTTPVRVYISVDANQLANTAGDNVGTFSLNVNSRPLKCGDGLRDGSEECDDGNIFEHDGCTPSCELEENYDCTSANPSVCTQRPSDPVCANVMCPALDPSVPSGTAVCCTVDQTCGVAYDPVYGAGCFERNEEGVKDSECPDATGPFAFITGGDLTGCCRPSDHKCGLLATIGGGCTERTEVWRNMQDSYGQYLFTGPFLEKSCTP